MARSGLFQYAGFAILSVILIIGCSDDTIQNPGEYVASPESGATLFEANDSGASVIGVGQVGGPSVITNGPIESVDYSSLTPDGIITFGDVQGGASAGTHYDGMLRSGCASFAERFAGQDRSTVIVFGNPHDALSSSASGPLALQAGAPGQNVGVSNGTSCGPTEVLVAWGPFAYPDTAAAGEGSFAVLFDDDQSEFGIRMCGGNAGSATLQFFKRDGSFLAGAVVTGVRDDVLGFRRTGGIRDIAGVSIHNEDVGGIGFDDICFDYSTCDENGVDLYLDIKPTSCPNPLNMTSGGVVPVAILGTLGTCVGEVNPYTILLEGIAPIRYAYEDVSTPLVEGEPCECTTDGPDGILDLTLKFNKDGLVAAIGQGAPGDVITLTLTGTTFDGREFELSDCMVIKGQPTRTASQ